MPPSACSEWTERGYFNININHTGVKLEIGQRHLVSLWGHKERIQMVVIAR